MLPRGGGNRQDRAKTDWTVIAYGDEYEVGNEGGRALHSMAIPEAAPVFNADGDLIGLCTIGPDGIEMLRVAALPDVVPGPPTEPSEHAGPWPSASR